MERSVLQENRLHRQLDGRYIALKINTDRNSRLVSRYNISSIPADVIISPNGKLLTSFSGYQGLDSLIGRLSRTENRYAQSRKTQNFIATNSSKKLPVVIKNGLEGYSPVSLWNHRRWSLGKKEFESIHKGFRYRFVSLEEKNTFQDNPEKFAPKLLGCDPVKLWKSDLAISGSIEYGAFFDEELYLFQSAESRAEFRRNPLRYTKTRHVLKPEQVGDTIRR